MAIRITLGLVLMIGLVLTSPIWVTGLIVYVLGLVADELGKVVLNPRGYYERIKTTSRNGTSGPKVKRRPFPHRETRYQCDPQGESQRAKGEESL